MAKPTPTTKKSVIDSGTTELPAGTVQTIQVDVTDSYTDNHHYFYGYDDVVVVELVDGDGLPADAQQNINAEFGSITVEVSGFGGHQARIYGAEDLVLSGANVSVSGDFYAGLETITWYGTAGADVFDATGMTSDQTIYAYAGAGADSVRTAGGDDLVVAGDGADTVFTYDGDDTVIGTETAGANDTFNGGAGTDTLSFVGDTTGVTVSLANGVASGGGIGIDTISGFENAVGGDGDDSLIGDGGANVLEGGAGNDTLTGNGGDDVMVGGSGDDTFTGGAGSDTAVIAADAATGMATQVGTQLIISSIDGQDIVKSTEFIQFNNHTIAVNATTGNAIAHGVDDAGAVTEDGAGTSGNVLANDIELEAAETMTVSGVAVGAEGAHGGITAVAGGAATVIVGTYGTLTINADGSFTYVADQAATQALADGETAVENFTYRVTDGSDSELATLSFQVSGVNDPVVLIANDDSGAIAEDGGVFAESGSFLLNDADGADGHLVSVIDSSTDSADLGVLGTFDAVLNGAGDRVLWNFTVDNAVLQQLGAGETITQTYVIEVSDGNGGVVTDEVTITLTGVNDGPVIDAADASGSVTEGAGPTLSTGGDIDFSDADRDDVLSVEHDAATTASVTWSGGTLTAEQEAAIRNAFSLVYDEDSATWSFDLADADADFLAAGETITLEVTVTVTDSNGSSADQIVTVTINGTNDGPVVEGDVLAASVEEDAGPHSVGGSFDVADVDLTDAHVVDWDVTGEDIDLGELGTFNAVLNPDTTGTGEGQVDWTFTVDPAVLQQLGADDVITQTYTITIDDGNGGTITQEVTVTITGDNDAPVLVGAPTGSLDEDDASFTLDLLNGGGWSSSDVDRGDSVSVDESSASVSVTSGTWTAPVVFTIDGVTGEFTLDPNQFDALAEGESLTLEITYDVIDENGGATTQTATVTVTGSNDTPVLDPVGLTDTISEDTPEPYAIDLLAGATDVDTSDDLSIANVTSQITAGVWDDPWGFTFNTETGQAELYPSEFGALGEGESIEITITYDVVDGNGGVVPQSLTVTVTGANDAPVFTETGEGATFDEDDALSASGAISFEGVDRTDVHSASVTGFSYVSSTGRTLSASQIDDLDSALSAVVDGGEVDWAFATGLGMDFLDPGETLTLSYEVTVDDGVGGTDTETVTITINGQFEGQLGTDADDTLLGGSFADVLIGGAGDDALHGAAGNNLLDGGAGDDMLFAGSGNDEMHGGDDDDTLNSGSGDDVLYGDAGDDTITAGSGNDWVDGGAGNDNLNGGSGIDTVSYLSAAAGVTAQLWMNTQNTGGSGWDTLLGFENIEGSNFNDVLRGSEVANVLTGNDGDDILDGRQGADTTNGGLGNDWHYVDNAGDTVIEAAGQGSDRVFASTSYVLAAGVEIEILSTTLQSATTALNLTGNEFSQNLAGNNGVNVMDGGAGDDVIYGHAGDDTLIGGLGNDLLDGGAGVDTASYAGASAGVTASLLTQTASGGAGSDVLKDIENLTGSAFNDTLTGSAVANILVGGAGDDRLDGRQGVDTTNGGLGDDWHYVDNAGDVVLEAAGQGVADRVLASVSYTLAANAEIEILSTTVQAGTGAINLTGNGYAQAIVGNNGVNVLSGGGGNDSLLGHGGDDTLVGGLGNDVMTGGAGADTFLFNEAAFGADRITDFADGVDLISFQGIAGVDDFSDLTITANGSGWAVITLADGSSITLTGVTTGQVDASDFLFGGG